MLQVMIGEAGKALRLVEFVDNNIMQTHRLQ
jgi:hypothetical protein